MRTNITRADGETVDIEYEEAQQSDKTAKARRVTSVDSTGNEVHSAYSTDLTYKQAMEYNASNLPLYIGFALPGTAKSAAGWNIRKLSYTGYNATDVEFGDATSSMTLIWNSRAGYAYS